jgi:CRP-like cAMP-binding protein
MSDLFQENSLLAGLSDEDIALLAPDLRPVDLPLRLKVVEPNKKIERVYFLAAGIASTVSKVGREAPIEIGITGFEGFVGIPLVLGSDRSPNESMMQVAGHGWVLRGDHFEAALARSATLAAPFRRYTHTFLIQASATALANGRATLDQRLARWLLMADDRCGGADLPLTHEFLSVMLGVRRPGVTYALQQFERRGLITRQRGSIRLIDHEEIGALAGGYYGSAESEYERVMGRPLRRIPVR